MKKAIYFILSSFVLIAPALYSRYPLLVSDSANYITVSTKLLADFSRPMGYSLFIRVVNWQATLWTVVYFQALIISLVSFLIIKQFVGKKNVRITHFSLLVFLTLFTNASWNASMILADVFTPVTILFSFLFFSINDLKPMNCSLQLWPWPG